jgi:hypothetical protein
MAMFSKLMTQVWIEEDLPAMIQATLGCDGNHRNEAVRVPTEKQRGFPAHEPERIGKHFARSVFSRMQRLARVQFAPAAAAIGALLRTLDQNRKSRLIPQGLDVVSFLDFPKL